jgi:hypothetical protein
MSAGAVRQGQVYVEIGADPKKLFAALGTVNKQIGRLGSSMMTIGNRLMGVGTAITAPILGAATAFSEVGDAVAKMAARTGLSTEAVSAFGFAAGQSGTDIGTLEKGVRTMQRTLDNAAQGGKAAGKAFERLGVDVAALQQMSPEEQFLALSDALAAVQDPGERAALAMQIFGRAGTALLPMFSAGADGIRALMAQAEQLGIVMDADTAKSAERLNDSIGELMTAFKAITVTVGAAVAPALSGLASSVAVIAGQVAKYVSENRQFVQQALAVGVAFVAAGGALTAAGFALKTVSGGLSALIGPVVSTIKLVSQLAVSFVTATANVVMYGVKSVMAAAASLAAWVAANAPLAIAVGLLGAVAGAAIYAAGGFSGIAEALGAGFSEAGANAITVLSDIGNTAASTFDGIYAELTAGNLMGAMDILWLGLKAGWARGSEAVMGEVDKWVVFLQNTWMHMRTAVATTWETMWSMLVQGGRTFGAVLQGAFDNVINGILAAWDTMEAAVRKSWNWVQSFIRKGYDLAKENNKVNSEMAARRQARAQQRPGVAGRMAAVEEANAGTAAQAQANIDAMNANAGRTARERIDASRARAGARRTATQEAEAALGDALAASAERAAERAAEAAAAPAADQRVRDGASAAAAGMQRGEVVGTFSAAAAVGMGFAKSLAQQQVDLLERIADNTEEEAAVGA